MPIVKLMIDKMSLLLGKPMTLEQLEEVIPWIGVEIEEIGEGWIRIEYNPNRPDLSSQQGIARALRGIQEIETGIPKYVVTKGDVSLVVDRSVREVRPFIVGAICRHLKLSDSDIEELMAVQEDIHWAVGRDRQKASIGLHNLDAVTPPFTYKAVNPEAIKFTPLGGDKLVDLQEILKSHPKGIAYKHLVEGCPKYPVIVDKDDQVLSFPPIINGTVTQVTEETKNLFIDVTGTVSRSVNDALNLIVTQLSEMGSTIESITLVEGEKKVNTPTLEPKEFSFSPEYVNKVLGLQLSPNQMVHCLRKQRFDAKLMQGGRIKAIVPPYRIDMLHEVDFAEEVAVGYGYFNIQPVLPSSLTMGKPNTIRKLESLTRRLMIGLGYQEVINFTLTNEAEHCSYMRIRPTPLVKLLNPVSSEYNILRETLLPGLIRVLRTNKHEKLPQRVFEVGDVMRPDPQTETSVSQELHCAAATLHPSASFAEIKSTFVGFVGGLIGHAERISFQKVDHPSFINGRVAKASIDSREIAILGEMHPEVLVNFELEYPVAAFEMNAEALPSQ